MNILAAVIVGIVANVVFTAVLLMAPKMGLPKMALIGMLSTMFGGDNGVLGWTSIS